jgi:hypothetical protein
MCLGIMQSEHGKELLFVIHPFSSSRARMEHRRRGSTGGARPGGCGHQRCTGRGIVAAQAMPGPGLTAARPWSAGCSQQRLDRGKTGGLNDEVPAVEKSGGRARWSD